MALRPLRPADADPESFKVLVAAAGISVAFFLDGWAVTSAKVLAVLNLPASRASPFTAALVAAGRAPVLGDETGVEGRCCCLDSLHSLVLSASLVLFFPLLRHLPERSRLGATLILQQKSTLTSPLLL